MFHKYDDYLKTQGYEPLLEVFDNWEYVKDEFVKSDRKKGDGNGTVHIFLGAKNSEIVTKLLNGNSTINILHYVDVNFLYGMSGYCAKICNESSIAFNANDYLKKLSQIGNYLEFPSELKFQDRRPYFKQFKNYDLLRDLLFPKVFKYKIKLYQNQSTKGIIAAWLLAYSEYDNSVIVGNEKIVSYSEKISPQNLIFFGCPGTGKSRQVTKKVADEGFTEYKVTFHPEYDYANFVGAYKPYTEADKKITYQFVPQAFIKAYVAAWKNPDKPYCLTIEEINRGNCAAIFGDIFQLLDRDKTDFYSEYPIQADTDIAKYLEQELTGTGYASQIQALCAKREVKDIENPYEILCLPPNLSLFATMNTSDQSLFPMDSAFKRRWQWKYVPINYADAEQFTLKIGNKNYKWANFLQIINDKIYNITESEDKQMGNRFVSPNDNIIDEELFVNKVLFYLWFDIFKNEDNKSLNYIFKTSENQLLKYVDLFLADGKPNLTVIEQFLEYNKIAIK